MTPKFWPTTLPQGPANGISIGPEDVRAQFEPEFGPSITRPRVSVAVVAHDAQFTFEDAEIATFESFFANDLAQGTARFVWRDPVDGTPYWWRFAGPYSKRHPITRVATVSASLLRLPNIVWFTDYVRTGNSRSPAWVADYENGVYGIGTEKVPASDLPSISGTYFVVRVTSGGTTEGEETLVAGDITEAQPVGTDRIVGYDPL